MNYRGHGSIRRKLTEIIILTCCVAAVPAFAIFGMYDMHIARISALHNLTTLTRVTGNNSTAALAFRDSEAGAKILKSLRADPEIVQAALYTPDGKVLSVFDGRAGSARFVSPNPQADGTSIEGNRIRAFFRVKLNSQLLGTIYVESTTALLAERQKGLLVMGGLSSLLSLIIAVLLGFRLQDTISKPILDLAKTAFNVSLEKDYSLRATVKGSNEIAFLYQQFNEMLDGIQKRDKKLQTARAELEQRVAERTAYLNALIENSPVGIVTTDDAGRIRMCNAAFEKLFGFSRSAVIGEDLNALIVPPELMDEARALIERRKSGERVQTISRRCRKDGTPVDVELYGVPLTFDGRQTDGLVLYHDVGERKRAEETLRTAKNAAEDANRAKSEFLANMSHEIRTPMNGIIGMTQLALEANLNPEVKQYLTLVKSSADSLLVLLNDILDYSKIEAGKIEFESVPFDLRENLGQTMKTLGHSAHRKKLELAWEVAPAVPDWLVGDCGRLRQVLVNLVGNAIKFTEKGEVVVSAELAASGPDFAELRFAVRDTGIGIPHEKQQLIFAAFTQGDASTTRKYGGTGLGLTIVQRLVSLMGGDLRLESELNKGSTFLFTVRLALPPQGFLPPVVAEPDSLRNLPVLIVDDNQTNRVILDKTFTHWAMAPQAVQNAEDALDALRRAKNIGNPFAIAIVDAQMPAMDGFMLAEEIQRDGAFPNLTIIMLTSGSIAGDAQRARRSGISAVLTKPAQPSELLNAILTARRKIAPQQLAPSEPAASSQRHSRRLRILLAEDNAVNRLLATRLLEKHGHIVFSANNGHEALAALERGPVDLILMDVQMPEMDGLEATRIIRRQERTSGAHIPIISVTARAMKGDRENCLRAGADDYVSKPLDHTQLFEAIERCCPAAGPEKSARREDVCAPILDENKMLARCQGDRQLLVEMMALFQSSAEGLLREIQASLTADRVESLAAAAHTLKGAISNFTTGAAYEAAANLEAAAAQGDLSNVQAHFAQLDISLRRLGSALKDYVDAPVSHAHEPSAGSQNPELQFRS